MSDSSMAVDPHVYSDDNYDPEDTQSEVTSLSSTIYKGVMENGRRYQTVREDKYWSPSDDKQFESLEAFHLVCMVLDSKEPNRMFQAPIGPSPKHILDIGTGKATWSVDMADIYPDALIRGVDLFPPPITWIPSNCVLEVDDALKEWTWPEPFDLIHMRTMLGAFTPQEWDDVYKQCYENLKPGAWIEQVEAGVTVTSDDDSLPDDSLLRTWGPNTLRAAEKSGRPIDTMDTMRAAIEKAGFFDIHEKVYKLPIGPWPKDPILKEAGRLNYQQFRSGVEGWAMWLLTKHGAPEPWTKEEVLTYVAKLQAEIKNPHYHSYHFMRRVWARKPLSA